VSERGNDISSLLFAACTAVPKFRRGAPHTSARDQEGDASNINLAQVVCVSVCAVRANMRERTCSQSKVARRAGGRTASFAFVTFIAAKVLLACYTSDIIN
jgi:hypothetical protein